MNIRKCNIDGLAIVELNRLQDDRGFFARTFCENEFRDAGLNPKIVQCNLSYNKNKGTLRGMHFQRAPKQETKTVRWVTGRNYGCRCGFA